MDFEEAIFLFFFSNFLGLSRRFSRFYTANTLFFVGSFCKWVIQSMLRLYIYKAIWVLTVTFCAFTLLPLTEIDRCWVRWSIPFHSQSFSTIHLNYF
jgi:hypothetical protein